MSEQGTEKDAGCYICQPENPDAAEEGCSRCERKFWTYISHVNAALCDEPCCQACDGAGADMSGPCADCYGTGHAHLMPAEDIRPEPDAARAGQAGGESDG